MNELEMGGFVRCREFLQMATEGLHIYVVPHFCCPTSMSDLQVIAEVPSIDVVLKIVVHVAVVSDFVDGD